MRHIVLYNPKKKRKLLKAFFGILLVLSLFVFSGVFLKQNVDFKKLKAPEFVDHINNGVEELQTLKKYTDIQDISKRQEIEKTLLLAKKEFEQANITLITYDPVYFRYIPGTPFHAVYESIDIFIQTIDVLHEISGILNNCLENLNFDCVGLSDIDTLVGRYTSITSKLQKINTTVFPEDIRNKFYTLNTELLEKTDTAVEWYVEHRNELEQIFALYEPQTYLLVLQNSTEARPTGGFIGSMVYLTIFQGKIQGIEFVDPYQFDYASGVYVDAPDYLKFIKRISINESNYSPEVTVSGKRFIENTKKMHGPTIDGVIFISLGVLDNIFAIVPQIQWKEKTVTKENFFELLEWEIEKHNLDEYERQASPKEGFFEFIEVAVSNVLKCNCVEKIRSVLPEIIAKKQVQIYSVHPQLQKMFYEFGMVTEFPESEKTDFFAVIFSSYFSKSDRFIRKEITHTTEEKEDHYENTVNIHLTHTFSLQDQKYILASLPQLSALSENSNNYMVHVLGKSPYNMFMEVFIPKEAVDVRINGVTEDEVEYRKDYERAVIGVTDTLSPLEQRDITLTYKIPKENTYTLEVYAQADHTIDFEKIFISENGEKILYNGILDRDIILK